MEYLVTMTTHVPHGTPDEAVEDVRAREAARSRELAAQGYLLRLWRPPLQPGEWRSLGLFAADDGDQLEEVLASMPLRIWRTDHRPRLADKAELVPAHDPGPYDPPGSPAHHVPAGRLGRRGGGGQPFHLRVPADCGSGPHQAGRRRREHPALARHDSSRAR